CLTSPLLFYGVIHPRPPPPFPTRRSSDLDERGEYEAGAHVEQAAAERIGDRNRCDTDERRRQPQRGLVEAQGQPEACHQIREQKDRKSTRLNSSHVKISYAVFCLKKKKKH